MKADQPAVDRIALREWLVLSLLLITLTAGLSWFGTLERVDQVLYDRLMQLSPQDARDDIIIVGIDDYSLNELGKWPWPRKRHAELIQQINAANPLVIGLDIMFSEAESLPSEESTDGDQRLAEAIAQSNKVVLPVIAENAGNGLFAARPLPLFSNVARQLGHIHLELDKDGVVRSVFLREGIAGEWWPHFSLAIKDVGKTIAPGTEVHLPGARLPVSKRNGKVESGTWQRDYQMHIPFYGSHGHFRTVPYVSVLRGEVPASFFKNKYVLVGPTALGMADSFPTPVSANEGVISGVEINANILASLLDERYITIASQLRAMLYNVVAVILVLLAYLYLSPRRALMATGALLISIIAISFGAMRYAGYWLPPSATILALVIAYPLWSWRRLEAAISYLGEEFKLLDSEPHLLPELIDEDDEDQQKTRNDTLEQRINAMHSAAQRVRDLRQFVSDSLASLPDPTLVTTTDGNVLLSNQAAREYFARVGFPQVNDALV
ncbi:MAG: CHASE2 domain-containing protein, partial [Burkholderiales bacterium]|nr:CHASE2 domain-containing protein [Burkholderiales bacterium]